MQTKAVARTKLVIVFGVNPSPKNTFAQTANVNIPIAKPNNLPGHITPSNAIKLNLVASIKI